MCTFLAIAVKAYQGLCQRSCTGVRGCGCPPVPAWRTHWDINKQQLKQWFLACLFIINILLIKAYCVASCMISEGLNPKFWVSASSSVPLAMKAIWWQNGNNNSQLLQESTVKDYKLTNAKKKKVKHLFLFRQFICNFVGKHIGQFLICNGTILFVV